MNRREAKKHVLRDACDVLEKMQAPFSWGPEDADRYYDAVGELMVELGRRAGAPRSNHVPGQMEMALDER